MVDFSSLHYVSLKILIEHSSKDHMIGKVGYLHMVMQNQDEFFLWLRHKIYVDKFHISSLVLPCSVLVKIFTEQLPWGHGGYSQDLDRVNIGCLLKLALVYHCCCNWAAEQLNQPQL